MTLHLQPLSIAMAEIAAAVHQMAGFHESWGANAFTALLSTGAAGLLAVSADTPVGLVLWRVAADEAEILTICTAPEHRRAGIGKQLMAAAKDTMAAFGATRIFLEVAVENRAAVALYKGLGFVDAGLRKGYYSRADGRSDALVMALTL